MSDIDFLSIDPVTRMAAISFKSSQGNEVLHISEYTFKALFGHWDVDKYGPIDSQKVRFKSVAEEKIKDPISWFENAANDYERRRAATPRERKDIS